MFGVKDNTGYKKSTSRWPASKSPPVIRLSLGLTYTKPSPIIMIAAVNCKVVSQNLQSLHLVQDGSGEFVGGGLSTHVASHRLTVEKKKRIH